MDSVKCSSLVKWEVKRLNDTLQVGQPQPVLTTQCDMPVWRVPRCVLSNLRVHILSLGFTESAVLASHIAIRGSLGLSS